MLRTRQSQRQAMMMVSSKLASDAAIIPLMLPPVDCGTARVILQTFLPGWAISALPLEADNPRFMSTRPRSGITFEVVNISAGSITNLCDVANRRCGVMRKQGNFHDHKYAIRSIGGPTGRIASASTSK
jgi:hypothetical protein